MTEAAPTFDDFDSRVGRSFTMQLGLDRAAEIVLSECTRQDLPGGPSCFTLLFRGGLDAPPAQGSYLLAADDFGPAPVFLVPVRQLADGVEYHAVFNQHNGG